MKMLPWLSKSIVPIVTLMIGLSIGLGFGYMQIKKEQKISQEKIKEANRKMAFVQKKSVDEKNEATSSMEQRYKADLEHLESQNTAISAQFGKLKTQVKGLEIKAKETDEASLKANKEIQELARNNKALDSELKKTTGEKQTLQTELKKTTQTLQTELKKTAQSLGQCESNNAELYIIAEELVTKYRQKGLGSVLVEKEPLTQIGKVKLEQVAQQYREEIEQKKIRKKDMRGKNGAE